MPNDDSTTRTDDRTAGTSKTRGRRDGPGGRPCPLCGTPMYHRHCKYVCPSHGVVYDCSDTFY
ncbi:HVO_2523 family zinc finger protein [Halorubrum vacuolatum]|uniref:HVO_2523 family zinc finger protein n=1 Tax=Halorubrum vacuolatum TaxID=63740 RepID=UPI000B787A44